MKVGSIDQTNWPKFAPLMLPLVAQALERGESVALLGLTEGDVACGAAAFYMNGSRIEVLSFYVAPDYRGRGGGSLLLTEIGSMAGSGLVSAYEIVLNFAATTEDHQELIRFLENMGYQQRITHDGNCYYVTLGQLLASPYKRQVKTLPPNVVPLSRLSGAELHVLKYHAGKDGAWIPVESLSDPEVERDVSCAVVKYGSPVALLLFSDCGGRLTLSCTWDQEHKSEHLLLMLRYALMELSRKYPPEMPMAVRAVKGSGADLVGKLVPDAQPISVCYYRSLE